MASDDIPDRDDGVQAQLVYTTFPNEAAAGRVAELLVERGLVACANILPGMTSIYIWEGKLQREREVVMILKTSRARMAEVVGETRRLHPYENPAIVALPIVGGSPDFLGWVTRQTLRPSVPADEQRGQQGQ